MQCFDEVTGGDKFTKLWHTSFIINLIIPGISSHNLVFFLIWKMHKTQGLENSHNVYH